MGSLRARQVTVAVVVLVLIGVAGVVLAGDRLPGYHRVDGPLLVEIGPGRGLHLGDLVVVVVAGTLLLTRIVRRGRPRA